jgi:hypothetical protein
MAHAIIQRDIRKGISVHHPQLTAWAEFGAGVRISLRHNPVSVLLDRAPEQSAVIPVKATSGPFLNGADSQQYGEDDGV